MAELWIPAVRQSLFEMLEGLFRELFYNPDRPAKMTQAQFDLATMQFWSVECDHRCEPNLCEFARRLDWVGYFTKWGNLCEFLEANTDEDLPGHIRWPIATPERDIPASVARWRSWLGTWKQRCPREEITFGPPNLHSQEGRS